MPVEPCFPENTLLRLPAGTLAKVKTAARAEGRTNAEWLRQAVRRALQETEREPGTSPNPAPSHDAA
jgi:hypothetical protein